jgi:hypothetical protein
MQDSAVSREIPRRAFEDRPSSVTILTGEPAGEGPVADVRSSAVYLRTILDRSH